MKSDNALSDFYSNVIHEFRTPLSLIISPAEQIIREVDDPAAREHAQLIHRSASKLLKLINEMLDISKIENSDVALRNDTGDLVLFVYQILESFAPYGEHKNISLHFYSGMPELHASFDKEKLEKVLYNIISNATKFTKQGGNVTVHVNLLKGNILQIRVNDTGIGITKEKLPFIFDRFYQADTKRFVDQDGTGIGLSYCKELIQLLKGSIDAKSVVDLGSEFIIEVPIMPLTETIHYEELQRIIALKKKPKETARLSIEDDGSKPVLLVVDDSEDIRKYLATFFKDTYQVILADDGLNGFEQAVSIVPDIIISDIMMPRMNGYELCAQVKEDLRTSHIPVLLLTAKGNSDSRTEGFEHGADHFLPKPFNVYELSVRVKTLIENRKRSQQFYLDNKSGNRKVKYSEREVKFLEKIRDFVEHNMGNEKLSVDDVSEEVAMSNSQLNRKLKALLDLSPNQFIRKHRLNRAKEMLEKRLGNISEIAYQVGFNSPAYFTKCFSEEFEILPSEV